MGRKHRHYENRILRTYFDTERRLQAVQSMGGCDGHSEHFAIELFQRDVPAYVTSEMEQAEQDCVSAGGTALLPVTVWHPKGQPYDEDIVLMRQQDFQVLRDAYRRLQRIDAAVDEVLDPDDTLGPNFFS